MKPFTDPFPFRKPENRSSIGEVIARITNGERVVESHTRAQLEKLSITRLRELKKKYEAAVLKGDRKASEELATVRGLLRAKGAGSVVDEGVVNGQPRPVEDPITEDAMTAERDAELRGKMKREKDYGEYRKLRAQREKEAKSKKLFGKGGKIDTSRKPDVSKSKQIWEGVLQEGGVKAALHDFMEGLPPKAVAALRPVMGDSSIRGGTLRAKVGGILKKHGVPGMVLGGSSAQIVIDNWDTFHGDLDEARMVGGADFLQGVKNFVQGKGFKTNREVVGDRVNANYAAMQKKKKSGKTPVAEGMSPCEAAALKRLQSAEAADLKEYPGKKGEAAHARLHTTIGSILKKK